MAENENLVTFSVTIALKTGKKKQTEEKNSIRKILTTNTWYDLFEAATENVPESPDFPGSIWNDFEKNFSGRFRRPRQESPITLIHTTK